MNIFTLKVHTILDIEFIFASNKDNNLFTSKSSDISIAHKLQEVSYLFGFLSTYRYLIRSGADCLRSWNFVQIYFMWSKIVLVSD